MRYGIVKNQTSRITITTALTATRVAHEAVRGVVAPRSLDDGAQLQPDEHEQRRR